MSGNIAETLGNLVHQTAFFNLTWGKLSDDRRCLCVLIFSNQKGI